jgi:3-oxoacyl-[acyl-carrier protein] reductase
MDLGLKDKGVIVTGGSKGIGLAIAEGFAREGAKVSICARNAETLEQARAQIAGHGGVAHAAPCAVGDNAALEAYVAAAHGALGAVQAPGKQDMADDIAFILGNQ